MRPRKALLALFPPGTVTPEEASEALRKAGGDLQAARRELSLARHNKQKPQSTSDQSIQQAQPPAAPAAALAAPPRLPPRKVSVVHNLSDRQYCCVWHVEVYEDGYRPDVARSLLAAVARHVNPILRKRGWRVKRLMESASPHWIGLCTTNGRSDADAASTNIQLNLRTQPSKFCKTFRSFSQILAVMLHEITHTSIGLEDIHPPAFYELLEEIKKEYREKLQAGEVHAETDDYGCSGTYVSGKGNVGTVARSALDFLGNDADDLGLLGQPGGEGDCGASKRRRCRKKRRAATTNSKTAYTSNVPKRRPLLRGTKMIDRRTKAGKAVMAQRENLSARELAARAALSRLDANGPSESGGGSSDGSDLGGSDAIAQLGQDDTEQDDTEQGDSDDGYDSEVDEEEEEIVPHHRGCGCRSCGWDRLLFCARATSTDE